MINYIYAFLAIILALVILKFVVKLSIKIFTTIAIVEGVLAGH